MKLFKFKLREDFGKDYYFAFGIVGSHAFVQVSFNYCDYASWPYIQIQSGMGKLFGLFAYVWKLGIDFDLIGLTWNVD